MACEFICDGCGKRAPGEANRAGDWFKPRHWFSRTDKDGTQVVKLAAQAEARKHEATAKREREIRSGQKYGATDETPWRWYVVACVIAAEKRSQCEREIAELFAQGERVYLASKGQPS